MTKRSPRLTDRLVGKAKRAVGEMTARPDLVLEGEAQDTGLPPENGSAPAQSGRPDTRKRQ